MTNLGTLQVAIISTGHVSATTAAMLNTKPCIDWPCEGGPYGGYGWFIFAHTDNRGKGDRYIPRDLFRVMTWARANGFSHIRFDRDARRVEGLPFFDW